MASTRQSSKSSTVTVQHILRKKTDGQKITMLTAYDFPTARLVDQGGVDIILVGDSLGMEELGYDTTLPVTMDDMLHHTRAVRRAVQHAMVVADMPFMSYQVSEDEAVRNAGRLMQEGGANAVKLEGGRHLQPIIRRLVQAGIPVMGHIGFTPQSVNLLGIRVQGRSDEDSKRLELDALALQDAGAFAIVLELLPQSLATRVTNSLAIPTIGIGSGPGCDGQVMVISDMIGLRPDNPVLHHVKQFAHVGDTIKAAVAAYCAEVQTGAFPSEEQSFK